MPQYSQRRCGHSLGDYGQRYGVEDNFAAANQVEEACSPYEAKVEGIVEEAYDC